MIHPARALPLRETAGDVGSSRTALDHFMIGFVARFERSVDA